MAMIASVSQLKSKLTEKGATRPSVLMRKKMPSGSSELQEMPRRHAYEEGAGGDAEWCKDVDAASAGYGDTARPTGPRAPPMSTTSTPGASTRGM